MIFFCVYQTVNFFLQAACIMVENILTAMSFVMAATPVLSVTVTEGMSHAPGYPVMKSAVTLTNHQDNAVENVTVCTLNKLTVPTL